MKKLILKKHFFLHKIFPGFLFLFMLTAYSCKTCNCPAYSYKPKQDLEHISPAHPNSDTESIMPDEKMTIIDSSSTNLSGSQPLI